MFLLRIILNGIYLVVRKFTSGIVKLDFKQFGTSCCQNALK